MSGTRIRHVPRESDEKLLEWLRLRDEGVSMAEIGRRFGKSYQAVQSALKAVDEAKE